MGVVANASTVNSASFTNPDNTGQTNENTAHGITEGYEIDSGAVTQALAATITSTPAWAAVMETFLEPAAAATPLPIKHQVIIISKAKQNYNI